MFPEMHLTVNEVEKMAARGKNKIKSVRLQWQNQEVLKKKAGTWGATNRSAPHRMRMLWLGTLPQIRASCKAKFMPSSLCRSYAQLDEVLVRAKAAGIRS